MDFASEQATNSLGTISSDIFENSNSEIKIAKLKIKLIIHYLLKGVKLQKAYSVLVWFPHCTGELQVKTLDL